jgi:hypothetical protein
MTRHWKISSVLAALGLIAFAAIPLAVSSPARADTIAPVGSFVPEGCQASFIEIPTGGGLQWAMLITCPHSE